MAVTAPLARTSTSPDPELCACNALPPDTLTSPALTYRSPPLPVAEIPWLPSAVPAEVTEPAAISRMFADPLVATTIPPPPDALTTPVETSMSPAPPLTETAWLFAAVPVEATGPDISMSMLPEALLSTRRPLPPAVTEPSTSMLISPPDATFSTNTPCVPVPVPAAT